MNKTKEDEILSGLNENDTKQVSQSTTMFRVINQNLFEKITSRIVSNSNVLIIKEGEKFGLFTYGSLSKCIPLEIDDNDLDDYTGELENTFTHLQCAIEKDEEFIIYDTSYERKANKINLSAILVNKNNILSIS